MGLKISPVVLGLVVVAFGSVVHFCGPCSEAAEIGPGRTGLTLTPTAVQPTPTPSPSATSSAIGEISAPIYGVTVDRTSNLSATVIALGKFSKKVTVRIVFDEGMHPADYQDAVDQIHSVAYILGQPADSSYVVDFALDQYKARFSEYLNAFGDKVDLWEVGNEVNGEWLGPPADVSAKILAAYDIVKAAGKKTVLTLFFNEGEDCAPSPQYEMYSWVQNHIPERMKSGVDYVLVSYYPASCPQYKPDWRNEFTKIGNIFPNSKLGFGELGITGTDAQKASMIDEFYPMQVDHPRYIKGFFWWYFCQDMVPYTNHLWGVLDQAISRWKCERSG
jgi:hypothetical protein